VEDSGRAEDLDRPVDLKHLPVRIDWNGPLPGNVSVPRVDLHSLVLDFSAVSFLDMSALKGLKTVRAAGTVDVVRCLVASLHDVVVVGVVVVVVVVVV